MTDGRRRLVQYLHWMRRLSSSERLLWQRKLGRGALFPPALLLSTAGVKGKGNKPSEAFIPQPESQASLGVSHQKGSGRSSCCYNAGASSRPVGAFMSKHVALKDYQ